MMLMDMLVEIVRVSDFVQAATDDRLGFGLFGYDDPFELADNNLRLSANAMFLIITGFKLGLSIKFV